MKVKFILIAEDEQKTREGLKYALESWGGHKFEIIAATNSEQAYQVIQKQKVHLFITDILMPEMTGLELLNKLSMKQMKPTTLIISSYSEIQYAQEAIHLGVTKYLLKPMSKSRLIEAVEEALKIDMVKEKNHLMEKMIDDKLLGVPNDCLSDPIHKAINYIDKNLREYLSLREVAGYVHLNPNYFSVCFTLSKST